MNAIKAHEKNNHGFAEILFQSRFNVRIVQRTSAHTEYNQLLVSPLIHMTLKPANFADAARARPATKNNCFVGSQIFLFCLTEKADHYFQNDFSKYQEELSYLFEVYTDEEIETLFVLLSKLYTGIENLETKTAVENTTNI